MGIKRVCFLLISLDDLGESPAEPERMLINMSDSAFHRF